MLFLLGGKKYEIPTGRRQAHQYHIGTIIMAYKILANLRQLDCPHHVWQTVAIPNGIHQIFRLDFRSVNHQVPERSRHPDQEFGPHRATFVIEQVMGKKQKKLKNKKLKNKRLQRVINDQTSEKNNDSSNIIRVF